MTEFLTEGFYRAIKSIKYRRLDSQFLGMMWAIPLEYAQDILPWLLAALNDDDIGKMPIKSEGSTYIDPFGCDKTPTIRSDIWQGPLVVVKANKTQVIRAMNSLGT